MNIPVQVSMWTYVFLFSPGYILRSGIAGSYSKFIFVCVFYFTYFIF